MLLPAQPEQAWDRGLLAIVVPVFACYVRRGLRAERQRIEGKCRSMAGIIEPYGSRGLNGSIQSAYGCAVGSLMLFSQLSTTYQPFKEVWHGDPINGYKTVWVEREGSRSYVRTAVSPIRA